MANQLKLDRATISQIAQGVPRSISALEQLFDNVGGALPSTIEEANALAGQALALAQVQGAYLSLLADIIDQIASMPAPIPAIEPDDTAPRVYVGTIASQNADQVEITGGTVDGTPIGGTVAAAGAFTTISATGVITSTLADGTAPLAVTSTTRVPNLNVANSGFADKLTSPNTYPANATDLPTVIALANALKAANIAKGV